MRYVRNEFSVGFVRYAAVDEYNQGVGVAVAEVTMDVKCQFDASAEEKELWHAPSTRIIMTKMRAKNMDWRSTLRNTERTWARGESPA